MYDIMFERVCVSVTENTRGEMGDIIHLTCRQRSNDCFFWYSRLLYQMYTLTRPHIGNIHFNETAPL